MAEPRKVIITCAVTGGAHTPTMSPALPYTVEDIVSQSVDAVNAGAAIIHLHARDARDGRPIAVFSIWGPVTRVPVSRFAQLGPVAIEAAAEVRTAISG